MLPAPSFHWEAAAVVLWQYAATNSWRRSQDLSSQGQQGQWVDVMQTSQILLWHTLTLFGGLAVVKNSFCSNCICLQLVWLVAAWGVHLASKAGVLRYPASIDSPWLSLSLCVADGRSWGRQRSFSSQAMESKWKATSAESLVILASSMRTPGKILGDAVHCCRLLSIAVLCGPESRYVQIRPDSFWKTGSGFFSFFVMLWQVASLRELTGGEALAQRAVVNSK